MLNDAFYAGPWLGLLMWAVLYTSDLVFTMTCARLYQQGAGEFIHFEGSFELNPYYQKDVDALRLLNPRFFIALTASCVLQAAIWYMTMRALFVPNMYFFALGAMVLVELTIHVRHVRNLFLFRALLAGHGIKGRIEYPRPIMLRLSSMEIASFAILYIVLFVVTDNWFLLGGAFACLSLALSHRKMARLAGLAPRIGARHSTE